MGAAMVCVGAGVADAAVFGGANVRATFRGWLEPRALPRSEDAPVALHLRGSLRTSDGKAPPPLRSMTIEINRHGRVSNRGLPICRRGSVLARTTREALRACRDSLVGEGRFRAHVAIPTQAPFPARGRVLAFNSRRRGRPAILAHVFGRDPVPTSSVMTLRIRRGDGAFGTALTMTLPNVGDDWGRVTGFSLNLHRRYSYRGRAHSLIEASCPAPKGFDGAVYKAAKGTYRLADGRTITRILTGSCRVSG